MVEANLKFSERKNSDFRRIKTASNFHTSQEEVFTPRKHTIHDSYFDRCSLAAHGLFQNLVRFLANVSWHQLNVLEQNKLLKTKYICMLILLSYFFR